MVLWLPSTLHIPTLQAVRKAACLYAGWVGLLQLSAAACFSISFLWATRVLWVTLWHDPISEMCSLCWCYLNKNKSQENSLNIRQLKPNYFSGSCKTCQHQTDCPLGFKSHTHEVQGQSFKNTCFVNGQSCELLFRFVFFKLFISLFIYLFIHC